ncbi:hypothetical protein YC2023_002900 [Brassica napus]
MAAIISNPAQSAGYYLVGLYICQGMHPCMGLNERNYLPPKRKSNKLSGLKTYNL